MSSSVAGYSAKKPVQFHRLSYQILSGANIAASRFLFIQNSLKTLLDFSGCDIAELILEEGEKIMRYRFRKDEERNLRFETGSAPKESSPERTRLDLGDVRLNDYALLAMTGAGGGERPAGFTEAGNYFTGDASIFASLNEGIKSLALISVRSGENRAGLLYLASRKGLFFPANEIESYEGAAGALGIALVHLRSQIALRERVKEMTCLYQVARILGAPESSIESVAPELLIVLPEAFFHAEYAACKITVDEKSYATPNYISSENCLSAEIRVEGKRRGEIEIVYIGGFQALEEGGFLEEEKRLLEAVGRDISQFIERKQAEEEGIRLKEQLRHADRLATIGQLAAGVAHELNEPLSGILGFAELAIKAQGLPVEADRDIQRIISASLHAREIVKKLLLFARQRPPERKAVSLNKAISESLYFVEARRKKENIELVCDFSEEIPQIYADAAQLEQVIINLAVNAIQAMKGGGKLFIKTGYEEGEVFLIVEDTGKGMSEEVKNKIFIPFFTTKDVNEGTGLGLAVVHGIVTAHGGRIEVESEEGRGSRFRASFPIGAVK